jgi:hypothetical protein
MKFLGLIYIDEDKLDTSSAAACLAYAEPFKSSGQCLAAEALVCCDPARAMLRVRDGNVSVSDGPFLETKEYLAGVYVLDVQDRDEAIELLAGIPAAPAGRIELRPILDVQLEGAPQ